MFDRFKERIAREVIEKKLMEMAMEGKMDELLKLADMLDKVGLIEFKREAREAIINLDKRFEYFDYEGAAKPIVGDLWGFRRHGDIYFPVKVGFWERLKLRLFKRVYIGHIKVLDKYLPLYLFRCKKHGYHVHHPVPQGWHTCIKCLLEEEE